MPGQGHPQAKFDPIPPDLDLAALVERTANFDYVVRISADHIQDLDIAELERLVLLHVIIGGKPLVIEGWNKNLPPRLFSESWLEDNLGGKEEIIRDICHGTDIQMTVGHYLRAMEKLTKQWTSSNYKDLRRQRLYLKDIDCPDQWHDHLKEVIPESLFYLNDCVGEQGGPGAMHELNKYDQVVWGKGVGPAGDLMSSLPPEMRAENMMCYIGHEGTYTPAHREMCASLGQNIMVEASATGNGENGGSSIWFMTESKDREVVSEYFLSMLGHDIEVEAHFAQINAWKKAPFSVYIVEQKVGDFVLIPPLAPHQVWNRGTRTMKVAWNRTTVETLELAIHEALPRARMVCRDEQYKNKAIIYYSLLRYYGLLKGIKEVENSSWEEHAKDSLRNAIRVRQLKKDFRRLFALFTEILVAETFSPELPREKHVEFLPFDSNVTCSYCRCNIFNRFLTCKTCIWADEETGENDAYDICMECYAMGRSCGCVSKLRWVEQWKWSELTGKYEEWRTMIIANNGSIDCNSLPQVLDLLGSRHFKKTVAQICQEQLKQRPWRDLSKPTEVEVWLEESEAEQDVEPDGRVKKRKPSRRKPDQYYQNKTTCHTCHHLEDNWKLAFCNTCPTAYCYGTLWRAFDLEPQTVMENPEWQCPKCLKICSCSKCRRDTSQIEYCPKGTLLGHDTRHIADPRSIESLVDFSRANRNWLRDKGDGDSQSSLRMQKLIEKAQIEKAREDVLEEDAIVRTNGYHQSADIANGNSALDNLAIDPQLHEHNSNMASHAVDLSKGHRRKEFHSPPPQLEDSQYGPCDGPDRRDPYVADDGHKNAETPENSHSENLNPCTSNISQVTSMFVSQSPDPDLPALAMDGMMGIGYYQQANDADKILFVHPGVSTSTGRHTPVAYPRLTEDLGSPKSYNMMPSTEDISESNKSKVGNKCNAFNNARPENYFTDAMTSRSLKINRVQQERDDSLASRLPVAMPDDLIQRFGEIDQGHATSESHIKPSVMACQQLSCQKRPYTTITTSDVQVRAARNKCANKGGHEGDCTQGESESQQDGLSRLDNNQKERNSQQDLGYRKDVNDREDSSNDEDSVALATRAIQRFAMPTASPKPDVPVETPAVKRRRGPRKVLPRVDTESEINQNSSKARAESSATEKRKRGRIRGISSVRKSMESLKSLPLIPVTIEKGGQPRIRRTGRDDEEPLMSAPVLKLHFGTKHNIKHRDKSTEEYTSISGTSFIENEDSIIRDDVRDSSIMPAAPPKRAVRKTTLEDYCIAQEPALHAFETGLSQEKAVKQQPLKARQVATRTLQGAKSNITPLRTSAPLKTSFPTYGAVSLPRAPPGEMGSLAEWKALRNKPFKHGTPKPAPPRTTATTPNNESDPRTPPMRSTRVARGINYNDSKSFTGDSSSGDDDEFIPPVRPVTKKPRIELRKKPRIEAVLNQKSLRASLARSGHM